MYHPDVIPEAYLPASVRELVDVIGLPAALAIVEARGGVRLTVPSRASAEHWLADLIGLEALEKLVAVYAREEIEVPRCAAALRALRAREIVAEFERGASNAELARKYHYTERGIRKLRRRVEAETRRGLCQPSLFADEDPNW
ncbi:MAG: DNA transposition protein [Gammaproteobacteria bacterium]|nr:MAG: DNA transposition protein [Gammaproteobacteria bacterium]